ncbi:MAG: SIS domain-containing protein [Burkholderiaceae bacterium]
MKQYVEASLAEASRALAALQRDEATLDAIAAAGELLVRTFERGGRVFACGNGGSMCDAMHFAEELTGRYRQDRAALPAVAIGDAGHLSCVGNDYGYEFVFSRYLEAHARPGDCLVALSTSGSSRNVLRAARTAIDAGASVIALTGRRDAELGAMATLHLCTPAGRFADRVQELHIKALHILIELVERRMFPDNYRQGG